jgi:hypothetical protein
VSPVTASVPCTKPRGKLTPEEAEKVDSLKVSLPNFAVMRGLAMRFRGILRGDDPSGLDGWLNDARAAGLYGIRRFAQILRRDIDAVRNAISEQWSNGQTEGQINRLKTPKRAMYGRAGTELLRTCMLPLRLLAARKSRQTRICGGTTARVVNVKHYVVPVSRPAARSRHRYSTAGRKSVCRRTGIRFNLY